MASQLGAIKFGEAWLRPDLVAAVRIGYDGIEVIFEGGARMVLELDRSHETLDSVAAAIFSGPPGCSRPASDEDAQGASANL